MRNLPEAKRKIRATKPKASGPFTKGTGLEADLGGRYDFGLETRRVGEEYRTFEAEAPRRAIPKPVTRSYGLPCAGCGISRPLAATDGDVECEYCGTILAPTPGARIYVTG